LRIGGDNIDITPGVARTRVRCDDGTIAPETQDGAVMPIRHNHPVGLAGEDKLQADLFTDAK
jgi:hypothetical protein